MWVRRRYWLALCGLAFLAGLALLAGSVLSGPSDVAPTGERRGRPSPGGLWVATFNLNYELVDPATARALDAVEADVRFVQESHPAWEALLPASEHRFFLEHPAEGGMGVLSRLPVHIELSDPEGVHFPASCVVVETADGPLRVLHLHLLPPLSEDGSLLEGYFTTPPARLDELRAHLAQCPAPDLVLGDLNEGDGPSTRHLEELGFVEAQRAVGEPDSTWSWPVGPLTLRGRPDHIFVGPRLEVRATQVHLERGASDHHPLRAQVVWR